MKPKPLPRSELSPLTVTPGDILSPGQIWISPSRRESDQDRIPNVARVRDCEAALLSLFSDEPKAGSELQTDQLVAVRKSSKSSDVYRARVQKLYTRRGEVYCDVFLIDLGCTWEDLDLRSRIRPLTDDSSINLEPLAFLLELKGLVPTCQDIDYARPGAPLGTSMTPKWNDVALELVTSVLHMTTDLRAALHEQGDDLQFSLEAASDRRAIIGRFGSSCTPVLKHFLADDAYYSLRVLLESLEFCTQAPPGMEPVFESANHKPMYLPPIPNASLRGESEDEDEWYECQPEGRSNPEQNNPQDWIYQQAQLDLNPQAQLDLNQPPKQENHVQILSDPIRDTSLDDGLNPALNVSQGRGRGIRRRVNAELLQKDKVEPQRPGSNSERSSVVPQWDELRKEMGKPRVNHSVHLPAGIDRGKYNQDALQVSEPLKCSPSSCDESFEDARPRENEHPSSGQRYSPREEKDPRQCSPKRAPPARNGASFARDPTRPCPPDPTNGNQDRGEKPMADASFGSQGDVANSPNMSLGVKEGSTLGLGLLKQKLRSGALNRSTASSDLESSRASGIFFSVPEEAIEMVIQIPQSGRFNSSDFRSADLVVHRPLNARRNAKLDSVNLESSLDWNENFIKMLGSQALHIPKAIQKAMWPLVTDRESVIAVGTQPYLTRGYLIPILHSLLYEPESTYPPPAEGPTVVILCPSHSTAERVWIETKRIAQEVLFLKNELNVTVVFENEKKMTASLANGCDILISTPPSILKCVTELESTNFKRCCHLVFEEADMIFQEFESEVTAIMKCMSVVQELNDELIGQTVLVSERWHPTLEAFISRFFLQESLLGPSICLGNFFEAAVYGQVTHLPVLLNGEEEKLAFTHSLLVQYASEGVTNPLIFCRNKRIGLKLQAYLEARGIGDRSVTLMHEDTKATPDLLREIADNQSHASQSKPATLRALILTDEADLHKSALPQMPLGKVLIHFDAAASKDVLRQRFSFLTTGLSNFYARQSEAHPKAVSHATVHMLLTPSNAREMNTLFQFLTRSRLNRIPDPVKQFYRHVMTQRTKDKWDGRLCQVLKTLGRCKELWKCPDRHFLRKDVDYDGNLLPTSAIIYYEVTHVFSPIHVLVKIKQIQEPGSKSRRDLIKDSSRLARELQKIERTSLQRISDSVKVASKMASSLYLLKNEGGTLQRVEILSSKVVSSTLTASEVLSVDNGSLMALTNPDLYELPEEFAELHYPRQSHELVLANLKPPLKHLEWPLEALNMAEIKLNLPSMTCEDPNEESNPRICRSKVILGLRSLVWVKQIQLLEKLSTTIKWTCVGEMRDLLLEKNCALLDPTLGLELDRMCDKAGIPSPSVLDQTPASGTPRKESAKAAEALLLRWAFLPMNDPKAELVFPEVVQIVQVYTPSYFHVNIVKFAKQLDALEQELAIEARQGDTVGEPIIGHVYIGENWVDKSESSYSRVQVLQVESDSTALVFFLDIGHCAMLQTDRLRSMPKKLIEKLPFQAIECGLDNILDPNGGDDWDEESIDYLRKQILPRDHRTIPRFSALPIRKEESEYTDCNRYSVSLTSQSGNHVLENKLLARGWARIVDESKRIPDFSDVGVDIDSSEEAMASILEEESIPVVDHRDKPEAILPPKQSQRPAPGPESWVPEPRRAIPTLSLPSDLPSLAVSEGDFRAKLPNLVLWSQDRVDQLVLKISLTLHSGTLHQDFVFLRVAPKSVEFAYLETQLNGESDEDEYVVHKFPHPIQLFGGIDPAKTQISVSSTSVLITMQKVVMCSWKFLATQDDGKKAGYSWLKHDIDHFDTDSDDSDDIAVVDHRQPSTGIYMNEEDDLPIEPKTQEELIAKYGANLKPGGYSSDESPLSNSMSEESEDDHGFSFKKPVPMRKRPLEQDPDQY